jgi:hypothetical protein
LAFEKYVFTILDGQTSKTAAGVVRILFFILGVGLRGVAAGVIFET